MKTEQAADLDKVPTTVEELAALEARYKPVGSIERWRGLHVDGPRWMRYATALANRWDAAEPSEVATAQERLLRATALDSNALDGLMPANPELTTMVLSSSIAVGDPMADVSESMRLVVECHYRAMVLANKVAVEGLAVDANLLGLMYDLITESQATYAVVNETGTMVEVDLPRGQFKPVSNYLRLSNGRLGLFAPAARVAHEVNRLAMELASPVFARCHPVIQAAYTLYAVRTIHPFADANGRLMRTVASIYLLRAAGVPLLVFADQWPSYCQALNAPDSGDRQALVDRVAAFAMSAMDLGAGLVARPAGLYPDAPIRSRKRRTESPGALDDAARRLFDVLWVELREALVSPPQGIRLAIVETDAPPRDHVELAYRMVTDPRSARFGAQVAIRIDETPTVMADLEFVALASKQADEIFPVALRETAGGELLEVAMDDVYPLPLEGTVVRVRLWVERLLAKAFMSVTAPAATARRGKRRPAR